MSTTRAPMSISLISGLHEAQAGICAADHRPIVTLARSGEHMAESLYREIIMDHYRSPRNCGTLDPDDFSYEDTNPLCGDEIRMDVRVR